MKRFKHQRNTVLALDRNFRPMAEISRRKAIKAVASRRAEAVVNPITFETTSTVTDGMILKMIIYNTVAKSPGEPRLHSGNKGVKAILRRDKFICAYCGIKTKAGLGPKGATVDHIVPKSQGGRTVWGNLACACFVCNQKKGGRDPKQANMPLLYHPTSPTAILLDKLHRLTAHEYFEN